jgi:hypothetical protein
MEGSEKAADKLWHVLVNNGYHYEYFRTVQAPTAAAARKAFKERYKGDWRADDFKVTWVGYGDVD